MDLLLSISIVFFVGLLFGKLARFVRLPNVTGYLIAGVLFGPFGIGLIQYDQIELLETFSVIALSFISFLIGVEFKVKYLKKVGIKPLVIALCGALVTMFLVSTVALLCGYSVGFSIVLGAICSSTATASMMMVVKEHKATGEFTNTMLGVVAIDDVVSVILFGFALTVARSLNSGDVSLISLLDPFREILMSILLGVGFGLLLGIVVRFFKNTSNIFAVIFAFVFMAIYISDYYHASSLLVCMVMGTIFINFFRYKITNKVLELTDFVSPTLTIIFFVVSGASLNVDLLYVTGSFLLVVMVARMIGKIFGNYIGAKISHSSDIVQKYLGPTMLSQTGLSMGLLLVAVDVIPDGMLLQAIVIASCFVFDLFSPIVTKKMLVKAGDIKI